MTSVSLRVRNTWPSALEFRDQLLEVVDLAVEDDDDGAVLVVQRLLAGREVDDRQAAVAEADARREVQAALVRAAVVLALVHARAARRGRSDRLPRRSMMPVMPHMSVSLSVSRRCAASAASMAPRRRAASRS